MDRFRFLIREVGVSAPNLVFPCLLEGYVYLNKYADTISDCQEELNMNGHRLRHRWQRDAQQCGIDKQVDNCASFLAVLYAVNISMAHLENVSIGVQAWIQLSTNRNDILNCNYKMHEDTCHNRILKTSASTLDHHKLIELYNEGIFNSDDSNDDEFDPMDLEDVEVPPKRKNADELAKREAYLWDHEIAVRAETTGPGIKTRGKFHRHKTQSDLDDMKRRKKKLHSI